MTRCLPFLVVLLSGCPEAGERESHESPTAPGTGEPEAESVASRTSSAPGADTSGPGDPPTGPSDVDRAPLPDGFEVTSMAVSGARIFVAGHAKDGKPELRGGEIRSRSIAWTRVTPLDSEGEGDVAYDPELTLDTSTATTRLAVARRGQDVDASLLVLEEAEGSGTGERRCHRGMVPAPEAPHPRSTTARQPSCGARSCSRWRCRARRSAATWR